MESSQAIALRRLLASQEVASLATLHNGEPAVSMVPYALLPQGRGFIVHVSRLATHTADMLANSAVALLVVAPPGSAASPQELQRASVRGRASVCAPDSPGYQEARAAYLARLPQSEELFAFADFSLFIITVRSVRYVGGFANAASILAAEFSTVMSGPA
jgi:putative heme iron utilization protein